ncbi:MAG: hypothetical protein HY579_01340 [Nitrospinae bacterium]|nr:hypothetical protein [Nitrospinota bacterium]
MSAKTANELARNLVGGLAAFSCLFISACSTFTGLSGAASMRVEVEVYKGPLSKPIDVQWQEFEGLIDEAKESVKTYDDSLLVIAANQGFLPGKHTSVFTVKPHFGFKDNKDNKKAHTRTIGKVAGTDADNDSDTPVWCGKKDPESIFLEAYANCIILAGIHDDARQLVDEINKINDIRNGFEFDPEALAQKVQSAIDETKKLSSEQAGLQATMKPLIADLSSLKEGLESMTGNLNEKIEKDSTSRTRGDYDIFEAFEKLRTGLSDIMETLRVSNTKDVLRDSNWKPLEQELDGILTDIKSYQKSTEVAKAIKLLQSNTKALQKRLESKDQALLKAVEGESGFLGSIHPTFSIPTNNVSAFREKAEDILAIRKKRADDANKIYLSLSGLYERAKILHNEDLLDSLESYRNIGKALYDEQFELREKVGKIKDLLDNKSSTSDDAVEKDLDAIKKLGEQIAALTVKNADTVSAQEKLGRIGSHLEVFSGQLADLKYAEQLKQILANGARLAARMKAKAMYWAETHVSANPWSRPVRVAMANFANLASEYSNQIESRADVLIKQLDKNIAHRMNARDLPLSDFLRNSSPTDFRNMYVWNRAVAPAQPTDMVFHPLDAFSSDETAERVRGIERLFADYYWSKINVVYGSGRGDFNMMLVKDETGNWNLKSYSNDPSELLAAYAEATRAGIKAAVEVAASASSGGGATALSATERAVGLARRIASGQASESPKNVFDVEKLHERTKEKLEKLKADAKTAEENEDYTKKLESLESKKIKASSDDEKSKLDQEIAGVKKTRDDFRKKTAEKALDILKDHAAVIDVLQEAAANHQKSGKTAEAGKTPVAIKTPEAATTGK